MIKLIDGELTDSWFRRVRAESSPDVAVGAESNAAAPTLAVSAAGGWDPWEVWLRHIDQPRRRLAGRRLKAPD